MNAVEPTIFIVDDDPTLRRALALLFECENLTTQTYPSADAFLKTYQSEWPGCVLLDIDMPGLNGLELQTVMKQKGMTIPIVFLTGKADVPKTVRALKGGALDFLEKPVSDDVLLARIHKALDTDARHRKTTRLQAETRNRFQRLTAREQEVMTLVVSGKANKVAARELNISHRTVEGHRRRVFEKMQAESLPELIELAQLCGLIHQPDEDA